MTELPLSDVQAVWQQACTSLQLELSPAVYNTWIVSNPLTSLRETEPGVLVGVITSPTAFHATNVQKNLTPSIRDAVSKVLGRNVEIEFKVGEPPITTPQQIAQNNPNSSVANVIPLGQSLGFSYTPAAPAQPLNSPLSQTHQPSPYPAPPNQSNVSAMTQVISSIPPSPSGGSMSPRVEDLFSPANMQSNAVDRALFSARSAGLRTDYTFTTFAVSTTNEMAHAAASAVSNNPGGAYNPLFLYGGVGVGKTHLMHAIGNNILKNNPNTRVLYSTGEEFTNEIVSAIQNKKGIRFKEKYRTATVLLIDDIQFIAGKNAVQEEFFHTFNALTKQNSQIVMTSDRSPHEINLLEDRLRSRFEAGLMIDIQQPTFELRTAILLIKAQAINLSIPMDLAQIIASRVDSARKIEGIITSIRSEVELKKRQINIELIEDILGSETEKKRPLLKVTPSDVLRAVANHYHVKQAAIKGQRRVSALVQARHVAMYLFKEELHLPLTEIGKWFSNRDHTSALHAIRKIDAELNQNELLQRDISALRMSLQAVSR